MKINATIQQTGDALIVSVPRLRSTYIDSVMRKDCFEELRPLFLHAHAPAKEFTESYAALHHFRRSLKVLPECLVLHIGDGAHCRTGALFAFMSRTRNVCIDPGIHPEILVPWMERYRAQRLAWFAVKVEDYPLEDVTETCLVTFVHAHVNTDAVLKRIPNWLAAYVNVCCHPDEQRTKLPTDDAGYDWAILSPEREYQVIINRDAGSVLAHNPVS